MKNIDSMSKLELIQYFKELQPSLRWKLDYFSERGLKECIKMHFSSNQ